MKTTTFANNNSIESDFCYNNNVLSAHIDIRMGFIRKVYGLLMTQLTTTIIICAALMYFGGTSLSIYLKDWPSIVYLTFIGSLVSLVALMFTRHIYPHNIILLGTFTVFESFMIGFITIQFQVYSVVQALILTLLSLAALTAYACQIKRDFSVMGASLGTIFIVFLGASFIHIFFAFSQTLHLVMCVAGALLFSLFIVFDTWLIMHRLSPEEHILATINLYLDILNLFIYILQLMGDRK